MIAAININEMFTMIAICQTLFIVIEIFIVDIEVNLQTLMSIKLKIIDEELIHPKGKGAVLRILQVQVLKVVLINVVPKVDVFDHIDDFGQGQQQRPVGLFLHHRLNQHQLVHHSAFEKFWALEQLQKQVRVNRGYVVQSERFRN